MFLAVEVSMLNIYSCCSCACTLVVLKHKAYFKDIIMRDICEFRCLLNKKDQI